MHSSVQILVCIWRDIDLNCNVHYDLLDVCRSNSHQYMNQSPRTKKIVATIELIAKCGRPEKICPILQPPATPAPNPIKMPPSATVANVFGCFGSLNLNSLERSAAIKEPIISPKTSIPIQLYGTGFVGSRDPVVALKRLIHPPVIPSAYVFCER